MDLSPRMMTALEDTISNLSVSLDGTWNRKKRPMIEVAVSTEYGLAPVDKATKRLKSEFAPIDECKGVYRF